MAYRRKRRYSRRGKVMSRRQLMRQRVGRRR